MRLDRKKMMIKGILIRLCLIGILCCCLLENGIIEADASMKNTDAFSIEVQYGYDSMVQENCSLPIHLIFTNVTRDFDGTVFVAAPVEGSDYALFSGVLSLRQGENQKMEFCVPLSKNAALLRINITDQSGACIFEHDIRIDSSDLGTYITVATVGEDASMSYLDGRTFPALEGYRLRTIWLDAEDFSENYHELDMVDVLVMEQETLEQLSALQQLALGKWLRQGGCLLLSGISSPHSVQAMYESAGISEPETDELVTVFPEEEPVRFWRCQLLSGSVAGINTDLFDREHIDSRVCDNILDVLLHSTGADVQQEQALHSTSGYNRYSWCQDALFELNSYASSRPVIEIYLAVLLIYIFLVLPGIFLFLKKKDKMHYLRELLAVMALLFSAIIFVLGARTRLTAPSLNYVRVLDYAGDAVNDDIYISVQIPYRQEILAGFDAAYLPIALAFDNEHEAGNTAIYEYYRYRLHYDGNATQLFMGDSIAVTPMYFLLSADQERKENAGIYGQFSVDAGVVRGQLQNTTGLSFKESVIVYGDQIAELGACMENLEFSDTELHAASELSDKVLKIFLTNLKEPDNLWFVGICEDEEAHFIQDASGWDLSGVTIVFAPVMSMNGG